MTEQGRPDLFSDVEGRIARKNKILFSWDSASLKELLERMADQSHRTLILWALDCAGRTLQQIESIHPDETRPRRCLEACDAWAKGEIRMPEARHAILAVHGAARDYDDPVCAALFHAIGQAGSTVHTPRHAPGLVFYELTALVLEQGSISYEEAVSTRIRFYLERLSYWQSAAETTARLWAKFLLKKP